MNEELLAHFITWTCYSTFLPGDGRGWTKWHKGEQLPQPRLEAWCRDQMSEAAVLLDPTQRRIVEQVIRDHCEHRKWSLRAVSCRSNHCHVVVTAPDYDGEQVRDQFKSWATRRLKSDEQQSCQDHGELREHWWTRKGSVRQLFDEESVEAAVIYTLEAQDIGGSKANL
jgi:REP element-mobilizing transposase RayT